MPLQNRVDPFGELFAAPVRGTLMGNRGGRMHDERRQLGARRWASKQWICCVLDFNSRHRTIWGDGYTELFFLDEVTAFAAGHRPCFECRRRDAETFATLFAGADPHSVRPRASGEPGKQIRRLAIDTLDSRLRRNARGLEKRASAPAMDKVLHAERLTGKAKRIHPRAVDTLPDGATIVFDAVAYAVRGGKLLRWTPSGYTETIARPRAGIVDVLTPPSILTVLERGYWPLWHASAG